MTEKVVTKGAPLNPKKRPNKVTNKNPKKGKKTNNRYISNLFSQNV